MPALLFFDIDGTLVTLDQEHVMPESTKVALNKAKANGHKIFINTGRVKTAIDKHLLNFGFDGFVCGCGTYTEYNGEVIYHHTLTKEQCLEQAEVLRKCNYHTIFEKYDRLFIEGEHGFWSTFITIFPKTRIIRLKDRIHRNFCLISLQQPRCRIVM